MPPILANKGITLTNIGEYRLLVSTVLHLLKPHVIVTSNCGKETLLCAKVYYAFAYTMQDNPNFKLKDCWFYKTSTGNQRIKS
jgi:hypothetical protein